MLFRSFGDVYHPQAGAIAQARQVFLAGNGLPERWAHQSRFTILETGFGLGNNFLATWSAWRQDPQRCRHLVFASIEKHPLTAADLARVHGLDGGEEQQDPEHRLLATALHARWPQLTPGLHVLHFDGADAQVHADDSLAQSGPGGWRVTLLLGLGDIADLLPQLMLLADAFYLDGFAPARNPDMWQPALLGRINRLAAPGATVATWSTARVMRDALAQAGFDVEKAPGFASKRDMCSGVYAPRHQVAPPPGGDRQIGRAHV